VASCSELAGAFPELHDPLRPQPREFEPHFVAWPATTEHINHREKQFMAPSNSLKFLLIRNDSVKKL
jgi:hypothetical protein